MGRELRRKQAKKDGKSLEKEEIIEEHQIKKLFMIILVLLTLVILIYLISALFITKELDWFSKDDNETKEETNAVSNTILASSTFNRSEEEYYVYFYDYNEERSIITDTVNNKLTSNKVYKVDTSSSMNSNYVAETGNKSAKKLEELKVVPHTLVKISNGTIVAYYENEEITNKFNN